MQIQENFSLLGYNTFGIDATARYFAAFNSIETLQEILACKDNTTTKDTLVLGGGSNMLLVHNPDAWVIHNRIRGIAIHAETADGVILRVGAGENWHQFVLYCIENNLAGVENLALIPGYAGAAPMQNIGAYGAEIKDVFHHLEAYHLKDKQLVKFDKEACNFGYRESVFKNKFKNQFVITHVYFRLFRKPNFNIAYGAIRQQLEVMGIQELTIKAVSDAVIHIRSSKLPDPNIIGNAGSFFKNPVIDAALFAHIKKDHPTIVAYPSHDNTFKLAAGWLIEQCGWKGYRKGDAGCHGLQALVLVNYGKATGREVYDLSTEIMDSVQKKFSVQLEREVNIV